jgi:hypothetical protein
MEISERQWGNGTATAALSNIEAAEEICKRVGHRVE